ncbi:type III secretion system cytoplasmic ring protein SctQ [Paraburkholderia phenazinium]|uniref:Type III secretion protein Q n=1 Tax=Paraburkholderia phenazinium TaxID=60549 RepID=A0A1G8KAP7_9BURK|nr:type III secretion system cytoplasmic ring protein SctQ [Paraburkholderia phenazinium]SDI39920.1 type III secretion protein Q [Paraburkholderia phenazinium]
MVNDVTPSALDGRLPRYSPALAQLCRALGDARADHPGVGFDVKLAGLAPVRFERAITLQLECAHGPLTVVADADDYPALQTIALDTEPKRAAALANLWLAELLARFRTDAAGTPEVKSIALSVQADGPGSGASGLSELSGLAVRFALDGQDRTCVVVALPDVLAADYERVWIRRRPAIAPLTAGSLDDIAIPGVLRLRSRLCSPTLLGSLRRNDILLGWQPAAPFGAGRPLDHATLRFGAARGRQLCASVRIDAQAVTLETPVNYVNDAQSDDFSPHATASPEPDSEPLIDVGALDLPVHIEVLTVNLSLAQLNSLQSGYVLELPLPLMDAPARLVAYGQTLAIGKLVAVGDNLGVQIHRMAASDERQS